MTDLIPERWYWVKETDSDWYPAMHHPKCAGGWTDCNTWEDFDSDVVQWQLIPLPENELELGETVLPPEGAVELETDEQDGPSDFELCKVYREAYYAHPIHQGPFAQAAGLRAVLARYGK